MPVQSLRAANKWSAYAQSKSEVKSGMAVLRDIARVHRGAATGRNRFFIMSKDRAKELGLIEFCRAAITSAKEIVNANGEIRDNVDRLVILDPPADINRSSHPALDRYLRLGERLTDDGTSVASGYLASHR